ncbi:DUF6615 family protein [Macrococcus equipercicus]|uniref:Uncharacterized protein n=1 Tax=Macrococcus equipercicus TaxID=69967 RepID=A0A9Q9F3D9_9STAP|nr:DUF6615 family protein [Macrococcus equipercicus]UTH13859.1 hypothetical protein KFV11_00330 [Macrococcus equipercicus]
MLYDEIREVSKTTWNKLKLLSTTKIKINEEGFTQDLIYSILSNTNSLLIVERDKKINESKTGADFFWRFSSHNRNENFAIQAKRVDLNSMQYNSLNHMTNPSQSQISLLLQNINGKLYNQVSHLRWKIH